MKIKRIAVYLLILSLFAGCSGISVTEKKDSQGRIYRKASYRDGKLKVLEEIKYIGNSLKPSVKIFKELRDTKLLPIREEKYLYKNQVIRRINYYIYINNSKILSGRINYSFSNNLPQRSEYYSIADIRKQKLFRSGIDIYSYNNNLEKRRVIEYEYNRKTDKTMQLSQYVILYENNKIISMQTWMLDTKSKKIIKNEENNLNIIIEMIKNIEKSLTERPKGIKFLK